MPFCSWFLFNMLKVAFLSCKWKWGKSLFLCRDTKFPPRQVHFWAYWIENHSSQIYNNHSSYLHTIIRRKEIGKEKPNPSCFYKKQMLRDWSETLYKRFKILGKWKTSHLHIYRYIQKCTHIQDRFFFAFFKHKCTVNPWIKENDKPISKEFEGLKPAN